VAQAIDMRVGPPESLDVFLPAATGNCSPENRGRTHFFALGEVRLAVLSTNHRYPVLKDLRERLGECYQSTAGTVYPALKQL